MPPAKPLPEHLHAAYDWTNAAGELEELALLSGDALDAYVRESVANWRDGATNDGDVTESALRELRDWLLPCR